MNNLRGIVVSLALRTRRRSPAGRGNNGFAFTATAGGWEYPAMWAIAPVGGKLARQPSTKVIVVGRFPTRARARKAPPGGPAGLSGDECRGCRNATAARCHRRAAPDIRSSTGPNMKLAAHLWPGRHGLFSQRSTAPPSREAGRSDGAGGPVSHEMAAGRERDSMITAPP